MPERDRYDVVVLGASGLTGRLVAAHLARRAPDLGLTWAAAGRDADRVRTALGAAGAGAPEVLVVDTGDPASLARLAERARVVLNLAGPYTERADPVVAACVGAGTSYADLSGETPAAARTTRRWHEAAVRAGVAVVQVAGYEALPFDVAVLVAAEAARGAGAVLDDVDVTASAAAPPGQRRLGDLVSGGTLASLVAVLREQRRPRLGDPALLLPDPAAGPALRRRSPLRLAPRRRGRRVVAPAVPAAFIDPPVVHRTAALRAAEQGREHVPFRYREGTDLGPASPRAWALAAALSAAQALVLAVTALPSPARRVLAALATRVLPGPGTGPSGPAQERWRWSLDLRARTSPPGEVRVRVDGEGHPGYAATARMLAELGLALAEGAAAGRCGCLTPALALGGDRVDRLAAAGVRVSVEGAG